MLLNERLYDLRKQMNYTQEAVADKLDVTRQTISNWESGNAVPSIAKAKELAFLYGISLDELVGSPKPTARHSSLLKSWEGKECYITYRDQYALLNKYHQKVRIVEIEDEWLTLEYIQHKEKKMEMINLNTVTAFRMAGEDQ